MAHQNEELIRKGYEAFSNADLAALGALMTDDVVEVVPGNNPLTGEYKGQDEVFGMYGKLAELSGGTFSATLKSVTAQGDDTVVAVHRSSGQRDGKTLDLDETITFTIQNGKIVKAVNSYRPEDQKANDEFWS